MMISEDYQKLWGEVKEFASLELKYAKLTFVEKLIVLLSMMVVTLVCVLLGVCVLFYLSLMVLDVLEQVFNSVWLARLVLAACFAILIGLFLAFKKVLVINPIAKVVSKMFLTPNDFKK